MSFVGVLYLHSDLGAKPHCRTASAAVAANTNSNAANVQAEVDTGVPGGPRLTEGQPHVCHCALRLDEASAATQQRVEPQRHARHSGEEEDDRVAGIGVERDGGMRAAGHALH
eukprot:scaffold10324_cov77-Phaeocystis_antarctica.AAC.4